MNTLAEENYLKAIYHLTVNDGNAGTNSIASSLNTKASSVTDMLKKLADKALINYIPYQGVSLTASGQKVALGIIRRHRLWEYFLVEKLNFKWDEVHDLAEEMEHISSQQLIDRLDQFMGYPKHDPHGEPIPDCDGYFNHDELKLVSAAAINQTGVISGVCDHSPSFLQYLDKQELKIGSRITVTDIIDYDHSVTLQLNNKKIHISCEVANNILIANE
ncbi:DtxR family iron (metal) dependent repressor [Mucilaginibacter oryzae]|uniref:Transcriptional regulator MntR n=1 Tax=Mucilaginibacter oryzae TaxID=468058 RepID=A0A316HA38_9SPHI|nr:metal-dependent transcriptional regulator [Mucilaginibacter oryzae]PWK77326.1 DtxR family iron (metal) dependent repressor [Mucilaginibacter oryzae]